MKHYWPYVLLVFGLAACTYMEINGDGNRVAFEKVGTDVDTDTHLEGEEKD